VSGSRITRAMLREAVRPVHGVVPTLQEIGDRYGVTRERIRQRLVEEELVKPRTFRGRRCSRCGHVLSGGSIARGICRSCQPLGVVVTMTRNGKSDTHTGHLAVIRQTYKLKRNTTYVFDCACGKQLRRNFGTFSYPAGYPGKRSAP